MPLEVRQMVYRFVAQHVRIRYCALSGGDCVVTSSRIRARTAKASSRVNTLEKSLSMLLVNRQVYSEARHYMYEDVECGIVGRSGTWYYPGALFEKLFETSPHVQNKLARMRHLVIGFQDLDAMLGTRSMYHRSKDRQILLNGVKSVKVVLDRAHDMARLCQPWGIYYESKALTIGTRQNAIAVLNKDRVVGLYNGEVLASLIEQNCFNQKVKILFEVHISPRKALLMKADTNWKVDMEVVWKKNALGSSVWF